MKIKHQKLWDFTKAQNQYMGVEKRYQINDFNFYLRK